MAARVQLREITSEEGNRLLRIVRRARVGRDVAPGADRAAVGAGDVAARDQRGRVHRPGHGQGCDPQLQPDGFDSLYPRYAGGRPQTFTLPKRQEIKRIALSDPQDLGQPFATWSLSKLADYLVAEGVVTDISHEGLRQLLREEGVRFQAVRTWKRSNDPAFKAKHDRIVELYELAEAGRGGRDLPRRVRALEPPAPARRPRLGAPREAQADPRDLQAPARRPAPDLRLRRRRRPALRPHQEAQEPRRVP